MIELHGKSKTVIHKDVSKMLVLFSDMNAGNMVITIPSHSVLYRTMRVHKYYNLLAELKGISKVVNGRVRTENALVVAKAINDVV